MKWTKLLFAWGNLKQWAIVDGTEFKAIINDMVIKKKDYKG